MSYLGAICRNRTYKTLGHKVSPYDLSGLGYIDKAKGEFLLQESSVSFARLKSNHQQRGFLHGREGTERNESTISTEGLPGRHRRSPSTGFRIVMDLLSVPRIH